MQYTFWLALLVLAVTCSQTPATAQTAYPMLMSVRPVAVQAGTTAEATVSSRYSLAGAYRVLVSGEGVTADVVPSISKPDDAAKENTKKPLEKLKINITAAAGALPGVRDLRLATPHGVSTVGQFVVVTDPVLAESATNDKAEGAQTIALPAAVCGAIEKNEDVDFYRFHVEAGEALTFAMRCARLEDRIHDLQAHADPIMTLRNAAGGALAMSDNNEYQADPLLTYRFEQAGDYLLEIRDVRYQGNQYWEYCVEISSRPVVACVFPLAVAAGSTEILEPIGPLVAAGARVELPIPAKQPPGLKWFELPLEQAITAPAQLIVAAVPVVRESPNENDLASGAETVSVPGGVNGRMDREGDVDCFAFAAKKGEAFSIEVIARRAQSALDSHLRILDDQGKQLALNDDLKLGKRTHADSWLENWIAPADGQYIAEVRDVHLRGGALYPYFLSVTRSQPYFELYLDADKVLVGPGCCGAMFVRIERKNGFTGEVQLAISGLPAGVTATCGRILPDKGQDGVIVLEAEADANLQASNIVVTGTGTHRLPDGSSHEMSAVATAYQETYLPGGGRGHWPVSSPVVAVTDLADIRGVTLNTYDIRLKPGESQKIEVTIDRSPGFSANVTLDMLMRHLNTTYANTLPPGVTLNDKAAQSLLAGSATRGFLTLTAAKDAPPVERQQAVVAAHVALNFVMKWTYTSRPVFVSVAQP